MHLPGFLLITILASTTAALASPERWRFDQDAPLNKRQDLSTDSLVPSDPLATTEAIASFTNTDIVQLTSDSAAPTSVPLAPTSTSPDTVLQTTTPVSTPITDQSTSSSSVPLLWTQFMSSSSRTPAPTNTATPTALSDVNIPFFKSKYHQMILALACLSAALLIALLIVSIIAFRARADIDLLNDRLSRFGEGFDLSQRTSTPLQKPGYGRVSMSDPDDTRQSRRSLSESGLGTVSSQAKGRPSGAPMRSDTSSGNRRVTFSSDGHMSAGSTAHAPLLSQTSPKDDAPPFIETQPLVIRGSKPVETIPQSNQSAQSPPYSTFQTPPPQGALAYQSFDSYDTPDVKRYTLFDTPTSQQIRRLPEAPQTSASGQDNYADPFAGRPY